MQTTFLSGRFIVSLLRKWIKQGPTMPNRETSILSDPNLKVIKQDSMNRKFNTKILHYFKAEEEFEDN